MQVYSAAPAPLLLKPAADPGGWNALVVFWLCAACLAGPAYNSYLHYDFSHSPDARSYMRVAEGDFQVSVTHRYRPVVPFCAKAVSAPLSLAFGRIWPHRDLAEHHLRFGFLLVNLGLMSLVGVVLFRTCQAYGLATPLAALAVLGILLSRWSVYLASLPLVDSFHVLCVALAFLAIRTQNDRLLMLAILLGPISKESFVFIAPITLLFGNVRAWLQLAFYAAAGVVVLLTHVVIDGLYPSTELGSVQDALRHLHNVGFSLRRAVSPGGLGEIASVLGLFNLVWLLGLLRASRWQMLRAIDLPLWCLLASVIVQALISTSLARMLFVASPLWAVLLGSAFRQMQRVNVVAAEPVAIAGAKAA